MQHITLKAASTATDLGHFTAIAATWSVDRDGDQIRRGAFAKSIENWRQSGKVLPFHWNHGGRASDVIGWVDPASLREAEEGLYVRGQLDLEDSEVAREAWRSMKNNAVALSFGYMISKSKARSDGVRELLEIDLFEISVVPAPANPDTRFVSLKAASPGDVVDADWQAHQAATAKADKAHEAADVSARKKSEGRSWSRRSSRRPRPRKRRQHGRPGRSGPRSSVFDMPAVDGAGGQPGAYDPTNGGRKQT